MKRLVLVIALVLLLPLAILVMPTQSIAQQRSRADLEKMMEQLGKPGAMQKMAEQAEAMQTCMADVDQEKLDALGREAQAFSEEVESLCEAGKSDEALKKAMAMGKKLTTDPTLVTLRKCSKGMIEMMKGMPIAEVLNYDVDERPTRQNICD